MGTDRLRVAANERVDIDDFRFLSESVKADFRQTGHKFFIEESVIKAEDRTGYILSGFAISNPTVKQLQVTKGKAILSQRLEGGVVQGIVTTEGDATKILDLNSYAAGDYGIYIRFDEIEAASQGRIFWNPTGDGSEYTDSVPTRYVAGWALRVESSSPGAEWLKIGEVAQATMTITDQRPFYFEGSVDSTYKSGWSTDGDGSANDRNADRKSYGITDLHTFIRATKQCLEDIKGRGLKRWWDRDIGGMNIGFDADPVLGQLAVGDADFYMSLDANNPIIRFDSDGTLDFLRFQRLNNKLELTIEGAANHNWTTDTYTTENVTVDDTLIVSSVAGKGVGSALVPVDGDRDLGNYSYKWRNLYLDGIAYIDTLAVSDAGGEGVTSNLVPADGNRDLGNTSYKWKDIYIDGVAYVDLLTLSTTIGGNIDSSLTPTLNTYDLGGMTKKWGNLWINGTASLETAAITNLEVSDTGGEGVGTHLVPQTGDTYDLGSATHYWRVGRIQLLNVSVDDGGADGSAHLHPASDSTFDLGKGSILRAWRNAYIDKVYELDAEFLWARGANSTTISESSWSSILPDTTTISVGVTSPSGQIQCATGREGWYKCDVVWKMDPQSNDVALSLRVHRNGSEVVNTTQTFNLKAANDEIQVHYTFVAYLATDSDYVEIMAKHNNVGNVVLVGIDSFMTVSRCKRHIP